MGKHERDWAEKAEIAVTDGLNGLPVDDHIQRIVTSIRNRIAVDNPDDPIVQSVWTGGENYKDPGDVHVILASGKREKVELKMSKTGGSGTAKNLGARTFHKLVSENIMGYLEFEQDYKLQRYAFMESLVGRKFKNAVDYCKELEKYPKKGTVHTQVADITKPGQVAYAQYASKELNKYLTEVNSLVGRILNVSGVEAPKQDIFYCVVQHFEDQRQTVEFYNFADMDRTIAKIESSGQSIKFYNAKGKDVIRFSVHWKNICQGGKSACFTVFIGNAFIK
jgi:hypothetical protein